MKKLAWERGNRICEKWREYCRIGVDYGVCKEVQAGFDWDPELARAKGRSLMQATTLPWIDPREIWKRLLQWCKVIRVAGKEVLTIEFIQRRHHCQYQKVL